MTNSDTLNQIIEGYCIHRGIDPNVLDLEPKAKTIKFWNNQSEFEFRENVEDLFFSVNEHIRFDCSMTGLIGFRLVQLVCGKKTWDWINRDIAYHLQCYLSLTPVAFRLAIPPQLHSGKVKEDLLSPLH